VDSELVLWRDYGCHGWPSLFLWGQGGALACYHLGEGEYRETELALREALAPGREPPDWPPEPLEPLRPSDRPGARVVVPTPETFPGGAPDRPWPRSGDPERGLELEYAAGGAYASVDGSGTLAVAVDGAAPREIRVAAPGLVELASHPHHQEHTLGLEPSEGVALYSLSFAPGIPDIPGTPEAPG
jgi:hypothetical protein